MGRYRIATFVNDPELYAEMRASFEAAGFVEPDANYTVEAGDPYEAITRLGQSEEPYVILVHQDVFADRGHGIDQLDVVLAELTSLDPSWAVAGNAGAAAGEIVRHIADKWGADWRPDLPKRVTTLDENFLVFRTARRTCCTPGLSGFHLYGTDVCLNAAASGSTCYAVDFRVTHRGQGNTDGWVAAAARLGEVWGRRTLRPHSVPTVMGPLPIARWRWLRWLMQKGGVVPSTVHLLRAVANAVDVQGTSTQPKVARALRSAANAIEARGARTQLKQAPDDPPEAYEFISAFQYGAIRPAPIWKRSEMLQLLELFRPDPPRSVIELGTNRGGTLFLLTRIAAPAAVLVTVDMPGSPGGGYPRSWTPFFEAFARDQQTIHFVRADSWLDDTLARVSRIVGGEGAVDALFIGPDHSYEGLRSNFERYSRLLRDDGLIVFHGIVPGAEGPTNGVPRFWQELKDAHSNADEVVEAWDQGGYGIGVLRRTARPFDERG